MLRRMGNLGVAVLTVATLAGCQCCFVTEHYNDLVDHVNDCPVRMDWAYFSKLDLTRINRLDGIQCRCGRPACTDCPVY
ncbi:hypothetical protein [Planctomyces sp. SH-PL14]|uniref:hypothetical protein n=1 Tax=Planctomyces sp. SH-PL14 TaxID=1632864 RepID=UPI00078D3490|nr:hypothetical protein [Planctomyces sp. SH-PL14]AMV18983.1 hypothetical protein VT03_13925 [Planctomyces sp. SH-PL14]